MFGPNELSEAMQVCIHCSKILDNKVIGLPWNSACNIKKHIELNNHTGMLVLSAKSLSELAKTIPSLLVGGIL